MTIFVTEARNENRKANRKNSLKIIEYARSFIYTINIKELV